MRINQPVTDREVKFPEDTYLISETDTKGIIREVNDAFLEISGFSRDELIGKSHNIVRHPDMPEAVYFDLWSCLKKDVPWRGLVKNRCKNGDYYWVDAQISPVTKNGVKEGYISVRKSVRREEVSDAERLYREIKNGKKLIRQGLSY